MILSPGNGKCMEICRFHDSAWALCPTKVSFVNYLIASIHSEEMKCGSLAVKGVLVKFTVGFLNLSVTESKSELSEK